MQHFHVAVLQLLNQQLDRSFLVASDCVAPATTLISRTSGASSNTVTFYGLLFPAVRISFALSSFAFSITMDSLLPSLFLPPHYFCSDSCVRRADARAWRFALSHLLLDSFGFFNLPSLSSILWLTNIKILLARSPGAIQSLTSFTSPKRGNGRLIFPSSPTTQQEVS